MVVAKKFILTKPFDGLPTSDNFNIVEEELPALKDGEFLAEAVYLSVDPYMRSFSVKVGNTMIGTQVAKIIESKINEYPVGTYVIGNFGWRTYTISKDATILPFTADGISSSLALGMLGMPGCAAYFGFLEICKPKPGETVVVSGAAGAVGSHVGQIAKIKGCTVIGIAGTDEKGVWLKSLGFDHFINYKTQDIKKTLAEAAPNGIDCYFDNVGGETSSIVLAQMATFGRITVCGAISAYNAKGEVPKASLVQRSMITHELLMKGFITSRFRDRYNEAIQQNLKWIQEGKLKYKETVTQGFENMAKAFIGVLTGENTGKAIVKV